MSKRRPKSSLPSFLKGPYALPSLAVISVCFLGYEVAQEIAFPLVVSEPRGIQVRACFTPTHNCQHRILKRLREAQSEILVMCYAFTDAEIGAALLEASKRGVLVKIITDKTQRTNPKSQVPHLAGHGIAVYSDNTVAIAHNKVMIIDEKIMMTGSFNYSEAAQKRNAENIIVLESVEIARQYKKYWQDRQKVSELLSPKSRDKPVHKSTLHRKALSSS